MQGDSLINARNRHLRGLAAFGLVFACVAAPAVRAQDAPAKLPPPPVIKAYSAILMDAVSGQVLYARNADVPRPPASTTKIMTATLLLEHTKPTDVITVSKHAAETEGSSLHLKAGERITARDMLFALMLRSANDGCVAVAEHIAGSERRFAEMMTAKAREEGATHTLFQNPDGLNENPNYTSARDLALMARYAFQYPAFDEAVSTKYYTVPRPPGELDTLLTNHAKFLWKFPGADGVKTGWTVPAGHCFVGAATWNGWRLISVVMHSPDIVAETSALMKYGFERFQAIDVVKAGQECASAPVQGGCQPAVQATAKDPIRYVTLRGARPNIELRPHLDEVRAPVAAGAPVGTLEAWLNGTMVGKTELVAAAGVDRAPMLAGVTSFPPRGWTLFGIVLGAGLVGYGTAITKTARRRRYRLKALLRNLDERGPGIG